MFHIGITTQHPPLPEPGQLRDMGIDFIRNCLTIDPLARPTATDLIEHPWMVDFSETLRNYENASLDNPPAEMPAEDTYKTAKVARQAAIIQEKQVEAIQSVTPTISPLETPQTSDPIANMEALSVVGDPFIPPEIDDATQNQYQ